MEIGFDVISDLNLTSEESFNWEGKATSLYCIVAGNVSEDLRTIHQTLAHLGRFYQGVFYISGSLEEKNTESDKRNREIAKVCRSIKNVAYLHNHVVIVDGVAIVGVNGWFGNYESVDLISDIRTSSMNYEDVTYLQSTIEKLQLHMDVKKIIIASHCVPGEALYFGENPSEIEDLVALQHALISDTESKVCSWVFGSYSKVVDTNIDGINYVNNSYFKRSPYWAKRIVVKL